jgi:phosphotransferase system HPr (HPr) family protein
VSRDRATATVRLTGPDGLHARPAAELALTAGRFRASLRVAARGKGADGRSVLDLLGLDASCGDELELVAEGPDAAELVEAVVALVRSF